MTDYYKASIDMGYSPYGNFNVPDYYKPRIYDCIHRKLIDILHYDITECLNGRVEIIGNKNNMTLTVKFVTVIHHRDHSVGIVLSEEDFLSKHFREIADYLVEKFVYSFTSLAVSALLEENQSEEIQKLKEENKTLKSFIDKILGTP